MSALNNSLLLGQEGGGGYAISRSLRFNSSDSAYLSRTPSASSTNRKASTYAFWMKLDGRNSAGTQGSNTVLSCYDNVGPEALYWYFTSEANGRKFGMSLGGSSSFSVTFAPSFRDPSAWYHIVVVIDTDNATNSDRIRFYVNGSRVTATSSASWPTQGYQPTTFISGRNTNIGVDFTTSYANYFNGLLADIHFIDGQALDPTSFGEFSATTGAWMPKAYTGTYGTNGFKLNFSNNSTAAALGTDSSGAGNHWTPYNLQVVTGGPTSVASASGALPIYNTTDTYGTTKGTGTRTDSNSSSIVLALPMDGANGGTTFTDESATIKGSGSAKTATRTNVVTSTAQSKFYGSSGYFDGATSTRLTYASSADFAFGTGAYTIEAWVYLNSQASLQSTLFEAGTANGALSTSILSTGALSLGSYGVGSVFSSSSSAVSINSWTHVAFARESTSANSTKFYVNGLLVATGTDSNNWTVTTTPAVGGLNLSGYTLNGYIQDLRVYKGVAKYTGNFNPPSSTANPTIGAGNDSLVDVPTNGSEVDTGSGGQVRGNYCTLNPLANGGNTLSNGNLQAVGGTDKTTLSTIGITSGKWYCEATIDAVGTSCHVGLAKENIALSNWLGNSPVGWSYGNNGQKYNNNSGSSYGNSYTTGDVIGIAFDADAGSLFFYKNGTVQNSGTAAFTGLTSGPYFFGFGANGPSITFNFGQRPFAYTAPSGFKSLCTANLPTPVVTKPSTVMDVALYTGNGSARSITGLGFNPDLVWIKSRSAATDHELTDSVRGTTKSLSSNLPAAEATDTGGLTAFNSDGFSLGTDTKYNNNAATYAAWCWDAGSSTVTNTQGSISSQVRANASAGFSICTMTTPSSGGFSFGHELGVAPQFVFFKFRNVSSNWYTYHQAIGQKYILLNGTGAAATNEFTTSPTSTIFTYPASLVVGPNEPIVAYCFAPVAGYSSFGSYTGNGSTDGPFVYCGTGFRPAFVLIKATGAVGGNWMIYDNRRAPSNLNNKKLAANTALQENETSNLGDDSLGIDFLSNGFKIRQTGVNHNNSGTQYIYAAFAESPFQYARAR